LRTLNNKDRFTFQLLRGGKQMKVYLLIINYEHPKRTEDQKLQKIRYFEMYYTVGELIQVEGHEGNSRTKQPAPDETANL
jgi:hypothetical protein